MNVPVSLVYYSVYCSGSSNTRFYDLKSVGIVDMAADRRGVAAA